MDMIETLTAEATLRYDTPDAKPGDTQTKVESTWYVEVLTKSTDKVWPNQWVYVSGFNFSGYQSYEDALYALQTVEVRGYFPKRRVVKVDVVTMSTVAHVE